MKIVAGETRADMEAGGRIVGRKLGFADFEAATYVVGLLGRSWSAGDYASAARICRTGRGRSAHSSPTSTCC